MEVKKKTIIIFVIAGLILMKYTFKDILIFLKYVGGLLLPSKPISGFLIILTVILISVFFKELNDIFSRIKLKGGKNI